MNLEKKREAYAERIVAISDKMRREDITAKEKTRLKKDLQKAYNAKRQFKFRQKHIKTAKLVACYVKAFNKLPQGMKEGFSKINVENCRVSLILLWCTSNQTAISEINDDGMLTGGEKKYIEEVVKHVLKDTKPKKEGRTTSAGQEGRIQNASRVRVTVSAKSVPDEQGIEAYKKSINLRRKGELKVTAGKKDAKDIKLILQRNDGNVFEIKNVWAVLKFGKSNPTLIEFQTQKSGTWKRLSPPSP